MQVVGAEVASFRSLVWFGGEPGKSFPIKVDSKGINTSNEDVYTQVKFEFFYKVWVRDVALYHTILAYF
jgi:hypothetical protein